MKQNLQICKKIVKDVQTIPTFFPDTDDESLLIKTGYLSECVFS